MEILAVLLVAGYWGLWFILITRRLRRLRDGVADLRDTWASCLCPEDEIPDPPTLYPKPLGWEWAGVCIVEPPALLFFGPLAFLPVLETRNCREDMIWYLNWAAHCRCGAWPRAAQGDR